MSKEALVIAVISSGALSALISGLFMVISNIQKEDNGVRAGTRILLYDRIKHLGRTYIERGTITIEELDDIHDMHRIYHTDLGGNGFLDTLMKKIENLPIE